MKTNNLICTALIGSTCTLSVLGHSMSAKAVDIKPVDIELIFLIDSSASISQNDFNTQINTFSKIFSATNFYDVFVKPLPTHKLAVSAYQFGTEGTLQTPVISQLADWVLIDEQNQKAGTAFGLDLSDGINTKVGNLTPIGDAVSFATNALLNNQYDGHKVINLSSDGLNEGDTITISAAAAYAFNKKVTINAIVIPGTGSEIANNYTGTPYSLSTITNIVETSPFIPADYKRKNLDGSPAFITMDYATGQKTLEEELLLKLGRETIGKTLFSFSSALIFTSPSPSSIPSSSQNSNSVPEPLTILGSLTALGFGAFFKRKLS